MNVRDGSDNDVEVELDEAWSTEQGPPARDETPPKPSRDEPLWLTRAQMVDTRLRRQYEPYLLLRSALLLVCEAAGDQLWPVVVAYASDVDLITVNAASAGPLHQETLKLFAYDWYSEVDYLRTFVVMAVRRLNECATLAHRIYLDQLVLVKHVASVESFPAEDVARPFLARIWQETFDGCKRWGRQWNVRQWCRCQTGSDYRRYFQTYSRAHYAAKNLSIRSPPTGIVRLRDVAIETHSGAICLCDLEEETSDMVLMEIHALWANKYISLDIRTDTLHYTP